MEGEQLDGTPVGIETLRRTWDIRHLVHYQNGGPSAVHNRLLLCPQHHTCVHEGGLGITGEPHGNLMFHRPGGPEITASTLGGSEGQEPNASPAAFLAVRARFQNP